jgi:hypothetical protein
MKECTSWPEALLKADHRSFVVAFPDTRFSQSLRYACCVILTVCVGFEVVRNSPQESLSTKVDAKHANDRTSLQVANMVEDLIDLESVLDGNFDGVGSAQRVEMKCLLHTFSL